MDDIYTPILGYLQKIQTFVRGIKFIKTNVYFFYCYWTKI